MKPDFFFKKNSIWNDKIAKKKIQCKKINPKIKTMLTYVKFSNLQLKKLR